MACLSGRSPACCQVGLLPVHADQGRPVHAGGHQQDDTGSACSERAWLARMPRRTPPSWPDAALANRLDLGSIGGYIIGFVHRSMVDGAVSGQVNVM